MRRTSFWLALSALVCAARPSWSATVLHKTVDLAIAADGAVTERVTLAVRLDAARDVDAWSPYAVPLDENRELRHLEAWVEEPGGKRRDVPRRDLDWSQPVDPTLLHASTKVRLVRFPPAGAGAVLRLEYEVLEHPYYPALRVELAEAGGTVPVDDVRVCVHASAPPRTALTGDVSLLRAEPAPGGSCWSGRLPRQADLELAPAAWTSGPVLDVAWDPNGGWPGVGAWFEGLLGSVPRDAEPVRAQARELLAGLGPAADRRARLEGLLRFVRERVRYVGVEVGVGGYRPQAAAEVLAQRWGDCKGKALLLIDLLHEAGIVARPVLIEASASARPDERFATPLGFNHMIVGVADDGISRPGDPVADGTLFVDPTLEEGGVAWLAPATQGQPALLVDGAATRIVVTPILPATHRLDQAIEATIDPSGTAVGKLAIDLQGSWAAPVVHAMASSSHDDLLRTTSTMLEGMLSGAAFTAVEWTHENGAQPRAGWTAGFTLPGFGPAEPALPVLPAPLAPPARSGRWFGWSTLLAGPEATPAIDLEGRRAPVRLAAGIRSSTWTVHLPPGWCLPAEDTSTTTNALGTFTQSMRRTADGFVLQRTVELRRREAAPEDFAALRELARAEHQAARRRVRAECGRDGR